MIRDIILRNILIPEISARRAAETTLAEACALELERIRIECLIYQRTDINQARFIGIQCGDFSSVGAITIIQLKIIRTRLDLLY